MRLLDTERQQYREDGFFVREKVFSVEEIDRFRLAAERVVAAAALSSAAVTIGAIDDSFGDASEISSASNTSNTSKIENRLEETASDYRIDGNRYVETGDATVQFEHDGESQTIRVIEPFHHLDPVFDELVQDPRIVTPMCGVLGFDRVALWTDKINLKRPREGSGFRWHQDSPYWSHVCDHCDQLPNVMITLDDADRGNGCFRVVPGSHRDGFLPGLDDGTRLGPLFTDPASFDVDRQWLAEVAAGSLVVFDAHTVHGSEPNLSNRPRRAIVLTYQPADNPMFKTNGTRNFSISGSAFESALGSPDSA